MFEFQEALQRGCDNQQYFQPSQQKGETTQPVAVVDLEEHNARQRAAGKEGHLHTVAGASEAARERVEKAWTDRGVAAELAAAADGAESAQGASGGARRSWWGV
jgi:hypothetical protein